jgi:hypothetical protein
MKLPAALSAPDIRFGVDNEGVAELVTINETAMHK